MGVVLVRGVVLVPGHCDLCVCVTGGTNLAIAIPADPTDPLQTNWTKDVFAVNPIVNNTGEINPT